nr:hypothetical protein [Halonotius pteroides]
MGGCAFDAIESPACTDYRQLGATGTRVSELCFGTWRFGRRTNGVLETDEDGMRWGH